MISISLLFIPISSESVSIFPTSSKTLSLPLSDASSITISQLFIIYFRLVEYFPTRDSPKHRGTLGPAAGLLGSQWASSEPFQTIPSLPLVCQVSGRFLHMPLRFF
eukprot:Sdes_comp17389_c0_seq1m6594